MPNFLKWRHTFLKYLLNTSDIIGQNFDHMFKRVLGIPMLGNPFKKKVILFEALMVSFNYERYINTACL